MVAPAAVVERELRVRISDKDAFDVLRVPAACSVRDLSARIHEQFGLPVENQIIFCGRYLAPDWPIADCIGEGQTVNVLLRLGTNGPISPLVHSPKDGSPEGELCQPLPAACTLRDRSQTIRSNCLPTGSSIEFAAS